MPLPFVLAGAAIIAGGYGAKKGYDAKQDFDRAERINRDARNLYHVAEDNLDTARADTQENLEDLGTLKFNLYEEVLPRFIQAAEQIKNINFEKIDLDSELVLDRMELQRLTTNVNKISSMLTSSISGLGSGGLAGLAAYSGAGWLATASTGTAISSLSGVAATNATLAWFGGGSLAAGGLGMAGGTMVLGGIVAGPVLAVGGMVLASKAEEAKENARSNLYQAELAAEQMHMAELKARAIGRRVSEIKDVLQALANRFNYSITHLEALIFKSTNFRDYTNKEKEEVGKAFALAKSIKNLLDIQLLTEEGDLREGQEEIIHQGHNLLEQLDG